MVNIKENGAPDDPKAEKPGILLLGIGNCGRGDDGLGWSFVEAVATTGQQFLDYEFRYQLQVEDADLVAAYNTVIFVDAAQAPLPDGFEVRPCLPAGQYSITSHALDPGAVVYLTNSLFHQYPAAYLLAIAGAEWELHCGLSVEAGHNLAAALRFFWESFLPVLLQDRTVRSLVSLGKDVEVPPGSSV